MSLRSSQGGLPEQSEQAPPAEQTEPASQHPADQSWLLQILIDLKETFGRVDGRTQEQSQRMEGLAEEMRTRMEGLAEEMHTRMEGLAEEMHTMRESMLSRAGARWLVSLVVAVILAIGGMIYREIPRASIQSNTLPSNVPEQTELVDPDSAQPPPSHTLPHEEQEASP